MKRSPGLGVQVGSSLALPVADSCLQANHSKSQFPLLPSKGPILMPRTIMPNTQCSREVKDAEV
jgi:hypothetical protein